MTILILPTALILIILFYIVFESTINKENMMNYIKKLAIELIIALVVIDKCPFERAVCFLPLYIQFKGN